MAKFTKSELENLRRIIDAVKSENYEIHWQDLQAKSKGWTADINHHDTFKASSYKEALEKLAKKSFGTGTANMLIVSMRNESSTYQQSGKLSEMLKTVTDSVKHANSK